MSEPGPRICAQCHRDPPDGHEQCRQLEGNESLWLHAECEDAFLQRRLNEEGLAGGTATSSSNGGSGPSSALSAPAPVPTPNPDAIRTHVRMLHTLAKAAGVDGTLVLTRIDPMKDNVRVERFEIGDDKIMSDAVIGWSTHPNLNLYSSFAIFSKNMPAGARGGEADVCAVLAFVGDLDSDPGKTSIALDDLPLEPPYVIESSSGNFQPVWPLAKATIVE